MGLCYGNGTMLRRSAQLLLVAENDNFEGSIDPNEAQGAEGGPGWRNCRSSKNQCTFSPQAESNVLLEIDATFKVIVLRDQEELSGPSQHCTIAIT